MSGAMKATPFTIVYDKAEQRPYKFEGIRGLGKDAGFIYEPRLSRQHLKTGDYSIQGYENIVTVERKSHSDLCGSLTEGRTRFEKEHERMKEFKRAIVVIEASWSTIFFRSPTKLHPTSIWSTCSAWYVRFGIPWFVFEDRRLAELFTFRFLHHFYKHEEKQCQQSLSVHRPNSPATPNSFSQQLQCLNSLFPQEHLSLNRESP